MEVRKWMGAALIAAALAGPCAAGEFSIGYRLGATQLDVDGDRLSSGNSLNSNMMSMGFSLNYMWSLGPMAEVTFAQSFDPFPLFSWNDVDHISAAFGWQYGLEGPWRFTPKIGLTHSALESQEEDFFEGNEPIDRINQTVPFLEATFERRFGQHFGTGLYLRHNFEDFGGSTMYGLTLSWSFN